MPDERTDPLDFTAEERAEADTSIPDSQQWIKRDEDAAALEEDSVGDEGKEAKPRKRASTDETKDA